MSVLGEPRRSTVQPRMSVVGVPYRSSADLEAQPNGIRCDSDSETILLGYSPEPPKPRGFGDPAPLGLSAFALTTSVLSLINMQSRSVTDPNIAVGLAFGYGGIASFIAGMWDFALGNTFGALVFTSYGGFWISFATIYIPWFNIANASGYVDNPEEFMAAVGHYLIYWAIFTFILTIATIRSSVTNFSLFLTLGFTFLTLAIGHYRGGDEDWLHAGGVFGLISASLGWYLVCAGIWNKGNSYITLPVGQFPWAEKDPVEPQADPKHRSFQLSEKSDPWPLQSQNEVSEPYRTETKPGHESVVRPKSFALPTEAVARPKSLGLPPFYSYMYMQSRKI